MKIFILTLHRAKNYGSILQTIATYKLFSDIFGDCVIVDYFPERYTNIGLLKRLRNKNKKFSCFLFYIIALLVMLPSYFKRTFISNKAIKKYIKMTNITYKTSKDFAKKPLDGKIFCTGSDQVWNSYRNEGIDYPLFLNFANKDDFLFSFSSSFGEQNISDDELSKIKPLLSRYSFISVREISGIGICDKLNLKSTLTLDPTLLLSSIDWEKLMQKKKKKYKYILTYNLHHDKRIDFAAKQVRNDKNIKIINISYNWHDVFRNGKLSWCPSIEKFLWLFRNADYVIGDSFHACAFSIIFKKQFVTFYPEKASARLKSLLNIFCLDNYGLNDVSEYKKLYNDIDYNKVYLILKNKTENTLQYLGLVKRGINDFIGKEFNI